MLAIRNNHPRAKLLCGGEGKKEQKKKDGLALVWDIILPARFKGAKKGTRPGKIVPISTDLAGLAEKIGGVLFGCMSYMIVN